MGDGGYHVGGGGCTVGLVQGNPTAVDMARIEGVFSIKVIT